MKPHAYVSDERADFDSNCAVCGGKCRDSVHGATDEIRAENAGIAARSRLHSLRMENNAAFPFHKHMDSLYTRGLAVCA